MRSRTGTRATPGRRAVCPLLLAFLLLPLAACRQAPAQTVEQADAL